MNSRRSSGDPLHRKRHLLTGASTVVLALGCGLASPGHGIAQEITGTTDSATVLFSGNAVTSGTVGGQFGVINTANSLTNPASISLSQSEAIRIFSSTFAGTATVAGDFNIFAGATGTVVFSQNAAGVVSTGGNLTITGDLEGDADTRGGSLRLTTPDGGGTSSATFRVNGSTLMTGITLEGADGVDGSGSGSSLTTTFGDGDDTFNTTGLTIQAGQGDVAQSGANVFATINGDGGAGVVTIGTGGLTFTAGNTGSTGGGGQIDFAIRDSALVNGAVILTSGVGGSSNNRDGGKIDVDFTDQSAGSFVTFAERLSLISGADGTGNDSEGGLVWVTLGSQTINFSDGVLLSELGSGDARLEFNPRGVDQTVTGDIMAARDGEGLVVLDAHTRLSDDITIAGSIGSTSARIGILSLNEGGTLTFNGDVFVTEMAISGASVGGMQFDGNVDATGIRQLNTAHDANFTADFNGTLTIGANNLTIDTNESVGNGLYTFARDVGGTGAIIVDERNTATSNEGDFELRFDGATAQSVANTIRSEVDDNEGQLVVANMAGVTFNGRLGSETTQGDRGLRLLTIDANSMATFNSDVATQSFAVGGDGSTLTFNSALAGPQVLIGDTAAGTLTLDDGTIILGANVGDGDTVFDLNNAAASLPTMNAAAGGLALNLSANFTNGAIALIDSRGRDFSTGQGATDALDFDVTDTALTDFTVQARGGATDILEVTAAARTTTEIATILGITEEEAETLQIATQSNDETLIDLLTDALADSMTDPTDAAEAARQVGIQSEGVVAGSLISREMAGQQQGVTQERLAGFRSGSPRFVTAFAASEGGESRFAGGSLNNLSSQPDYAKAVWGQVYGGHATADGSITQAGFDTGYTGALIGIDGALTDTIVIGAFAGYGFADVDGDGAGNAQLETSAYQAGVYGAYTADRFYVDGFAAFSIMENDTARTTLGNNRVTGAFDASQITLGLSGGVPIALGASSFLTPNASLTWNSYDADGYTELGVGANAVSGLSTNTLTGTLGARLHAVHELGDGVEIVPEVNAGLLYELADDDGASARFVGGGTSYTVSGTRIADIGAVLGVGLTMRGDRWSAGIAYDGDVRSDFVSHTGRAEVRWTF